VLKPHANVRQTHDEPAPPASSTKNIPPESLLLANARLKNRRYEEQTMKKMLLPLLFLCAPFAAAAPNPADYTENLHVTSSHLIFDYSNTNLIPSLQIDVVTNGKKYELIGTALAATVHVVGRLHAGVLPVGDYKAKLIRLQTGLSPFSELRNPASRREDRQI
jgi:hypothetical protein